MTGEKYVSQIVKKIQCGKDRKDDISRQLMTEINERIAQGETIEDIIHEMGSAGCLTVE